MPVAKTYSKRTFMEPIPNPCYVVYMLLYDCVDVPIDYNCISDPCQNDAVCEDQSDGYICHCPTGFIGDHCQSGKW